MKHAEPMYRMACLFALLVGAGSASAAENHPVILGVDMAGSYHFGQEFPRVELIAYWSHEPYFQAIEDLGAQYIVVHLFPVVGMAAGGSEATAQKILDIDAGMRSHGLWYSLNNEHANFTITAEIDPGRNEFEQPGGLHRWDLRMDWLGPLLGPASSSGGFLGVVYDEPGHMQLMNNMFVSNPEPPFPLEEPFDAPYLVDTDAMELESAYQALIDRLISLRLEHYEGRISLFTEQIWSDMLTIFAAAGWNISAKLLMHELSSVKMAVALGAAIQYADRGGQMWVTADLHGPFGFPGHSPDALRSALLMGYWLGADGIYVENLDSPLDVGSRHPEASPEGALLHWLDPDRYEITRHGRIVQDFFKRYVPENPRSVDWRSYRPRVAIIRLQDGDTGQPSEFFRRRLLGNREAPADAISAEWLQVWPILTHGVVRPGAINFYNRAVYPEPLEEFFIPIDGVAVFDHLVTGPVLDSVECFVVCGHALSAATFEAIRLRVASGAACVIARRLYERHASGPLPGNWLILDSFSDPLLGSALEPFLGPPNVARFPFEDRTIEFRRGPGPDSIAVRIVPHASVGDSRWRAYR